MKYRMKFNGFIYFIVSITIILLSCSRKIRPVESPSISVAIIAKTTIAPTVYISIKSEDLRSTLWSDTIINGRLSKNVKVPKEGFYYIGIEGPVPDSVDSKTRIYRFVFYKPVYFSNNGNYDIDFGDYVNAGNGFTKIKSTSSIQKVLSNLDEETSNRRIIYENTLVKMDQYADSLYKKNEMTERLLSKSIG